MKICFILSSLAFGGAEVVTINLVNKLAGMSGIDVHVVCLKNKRDLIGRLDVRVGVRFLNVSANRKAVTGLLHYFRENSDFDYVVGVTDTCGILATLSAGLLGMKVIPVSHTGWENVFKGHSYLRSLLWGGMSLIYLRCHKWIMISDGVFKSYESAFPGLRKKMRMVPNAAYSEEALCSVSEPLSDELHSLVDRLRGDGCKIVVALGRFHYAKGFDVLLHSIKHVVNVHSQTYLLLIGDGDEREALEKLSKKLGIDGRVKFIGAMNKPFLLMRQADLYVHSSRWDGLPTTLIEASAIGLPCVSFDCDYGPREIIVPEVSGVLVSPVGSALALASAIIRLLDNADFSRTLSFNARTAVKKYSSDSVADCFLSALSE